MTSFLMANYMLHSREEYLRLQLRYWSNGMDHRKIKNVYENRGVQKNPTTSKVKRFINIQNDYIFSCNIIINSKHK